MNAKKIFASLFAAVIAVTLFGCGKAGETVPEETTVSETAAATLSAEELDALAANIPEIVFVMSYQADDENIFGCYVMNTGIIKLFDFRETAPDEIYDVRDVYDRLEEAGCDRLEPKSGMHYELLLINGNAEYVEWGYTLDGEKGYYKFYGIKENEQGIKECILLRGYGTASEYKHSNSDAGDMYADFIRILPNLDGITLS